MIRIHRPAVPSKLKERGSAAAQELIQRLQSSPGVALKSEDFSREIYAHPDVKTALIEAQHHKCAFCESKVTHIASGHIEHFRPKTAYKQKSTDALQRPGYYWLAFTWENLLFCCEVCNSRHKGNLFPLANPNLRVTSPEGDIQTEQPRFIDPTSDDPSHYIRFIRDKPTAVKNNARGRQTIDSLGLKREALSERRRSHLKLIKQLWELSVTLQMCETNAQVIRRLKEVEDTLRNATRPTAEYSAMARDYLAAVGFE